MTKELAAVLQAHRHLRGLTVLYRDNGTSTSKQTLSTWMISAQRRAGLKATGNKLMLRHTFRSHLAMRGATLIAIKELAGWRGTAAFAPRCGICTSARLTRRRPSGYSIKPEARRDLDTS